MKLAALPPALLALLLALPAPAPATSLPGPPIDTALLVRAAQAPSLPRRLSPRWQGQLEAIVHDVRSDRLAEAFERWRRFAATFYPNAPAEDLEPIVSWILHEGFVAPRPELERRALHVTYLEERALAIGRHLDQLAEVLGQDSRGRLRSVAALEIGSAWPEEDEEPFVWRRPRPYRRTDLEAMQRDWGRRLLMAQEDAVSAHLRLQALAQQHRDLVRDMGSLAIAMLEVSRWRTSAAR